MPTLDGLDDDQEGISEGTELDRPVDVILGVIALDGNPLIDWFWDGIKL